MVGAWWQNTSYVVSDSHIFGPTLLNTALFEYNRTNNFNQPIYPAKTIYDLGSNISHDNNPEVYINVTGLDQVNTGDTNGFLRQEYQALDFPEDTPVIDIWNIYGKGASLRRVGPPLPQDEVPDKAVGAV